MKTGLWAIRQGKRICTNHWTRPRLITGWHVALQGTVQHAVAYGMVANPRLTGLSPLRPDRLRNMVWRC